jgi:hypothetical protein
VILDAYRIREGVERERVLGRPFHTEEVDLRAEREHEVVVALGFQFVEAHLA